MRRLVHFDCCRLVWASAAVFAVSSSPFRAAANEYDFQPPSGWAASPTLAASQAKLLADSASFAGQKFAPEVTVFTTERGATLYVTWLASATPTQELGAVVRAILDELREERVVANPNATSTEEVSYEEGAKGDVATAELVWRHVSNATITRSRTLMWADPELKIRLVRAECVMATDVYSELGDACSRALTTLRPTAGTKAQLGSWATSRSPGAATAAATPAPPDGSATPLLKAAGGAVLYEPPTSHGRSRDYWVIAVGAALLATALYLALRSRRTPRAVDGQTTRAAECASSPESIEPQEDDRE